MSKSRQSGLTCQVTMASKSLLHADITDIFARSNACHMERSSTAGSVEFDRRPRNAKQQGMGDAGGQSVECSSAAHILSLRS